ncbi:MAG: hypothetical protein JW825_02095 [Candidatus Methanofastidiosa archaeon]|nr:hypothetical protein [Candidatus Methanofastidiosa archaeon]
MNEKKIEKMQEILVEQYKKDPIYLVASSRLRAALGVPVEEIKPYAEALVKQGYAYAFESFSPTFIMGLNEKGYRALSGLGG